MSTVVYTVILNQFDNLRPPEVIERGVRYICFTDQPMEPVHPWEFQPAYLPLTPDRNSRIPKILPHLHFRSDYSIYHDGNFTLMKRPSYLIERYLWGPHQLAVFKHPRRNSIGEEAEILLNEKIGDPIDVENQLKRWQSVGSPSGLWACGLLLRKHTDSVASFNERWWAEFAAGSTRDQMAFPVARHLENLSVNTINGDVHNNDLMRFHWHVAWKTKADNPTFEAGRAEYLERRKRLLEVVR